ncbi:MAG: coenzyme F420-0:L-glutamate ligase [Candidatus Dormibacteria bacterium]
MSTELIPVLGLPEVREGDDLAELIGQEADLRLGDIVVVAQKIVSKAEGQVRELSAVTAGPRALKLGAQLRRDPRFVELVLRESRTLIRDSPVLIVETHHGFVCANAGIDRSNVEGDETVVLLPRDCDASADRLRTGLRGLTGIDAAVIVSDTFGRAWRMGLSNVALGVSGLPALVDHRGRPDDFGQEMVSTVIAVADEIAAATELVMGKNLRIPVAIVRGLEVPGEPGTGRDLMRPYGEDLFR